MMERGSQQANVMRENSASPARLLLLLVAPLLSLIAALPLSGCGDFWQAPGSTGSTGTTATTTTLSTPNSTTTTGTAITLTATVSPSSATGTVTFYNNSVSLGEPATLTSGTATFDATFSTAGTESLTATYGGSSTYAESTSSAVTVTVTAASSSARTQPVAGASTLTNTAYGSSPLHAISPFSANGGSYTAKNSQAAVVESGGSIALTGTTLSGTAGSGSGVLLAGRSTTPASPALARFTMTGGSLTYNCSATQTDACDQEPAAHAENGPATLFSVSGTRGAVTLTDVTVANNTATTTNAQGTLLAVGKSSAAGSNSGAAALTAQGTRLTGDVILDGTGTAALSLLKDNAGTGSSLTGAINSANAGKAVSLILDESSTWTVTATSYLTSLSGLDIGSGTVNNIDGGGHCVYYSGSINGSSAQVYALSGGGFLAPAGTSGLACH
jgi:hypothetical protein